MQKMPSQFQIDNTAWRRELDEIRQRMRPYQERDLRYVMAEAGRSIATRVTASVLQNVHDDNTALPADCEQLRHNQLARSYLINQTDSVPRRAWLPNDICIAANYVQQLLSESTAQTAGRGRAEALKMLLEGGLSSTLADLCKAPETYSILEMSLETTANALIVRVAIKARSQGQHKTGFFT